MKMPCVQADLGKLRDNAAAILSSCRENGVRLAAVTKAVCADPVIVRCLQNAGVDMLADSRVENLAVLPSTLPRLSLRVSDPDEAEDIVRNAEYSLQSETGTIRALGRAAKKLEKIHRIILMIDVGDLREGIFYKAEERILETVKQTLADPSLDLAGIGTNMTCFGGILPDDRNQGILLEWANRIRQEFKVKLPIVSGGNSSSLHLLFKNRLPLGVNHLRVGEGLLLGMDTSCGQPFPNLSQEVFTVFARLIEIQDKPSLPEGSAGPNAFGETQQFYDQGPMRRGILAIGRQDTDPMGLTPHDQAVPVIGSSSDHMIVNLTRAPQYHVGDALLFTPNYGALLRAYTSPYVTKRYLYENEDQHHA